MTDYPTYNITACSVPRLVWFRNAKVGTRTIYALLKDAGVSFDIEYDYQVKYDPLQYTDYLKFAMVRNPWDRIVSGWKNKIHMKDKRLPFVDVDRQSQFQSFDNFVRFVCTQDLRKFDPHFCLQTRHIPKSVDVIGRFENFSAELSYILAQVGIDIQSQIPHKNKTKNRTDYRDYYTQETRQLVESAYRDDLDRFDYAFD